MHPQFRLNSVPLFFLAQIAQRSTRMLQRYVSSALVCASGAPRAALRNDFVRLLHSAGQSTRSSESTPEPSFSGIGSGIGKGGRKQAWSQDRRSSWGDANSVGSSSSSRSSRPSDRGKPLTKRNLPHRIQRGSTADPYRTSAYVKALLSEGKFDDAVKLVEETPKEGLDVPVFNKLLHYAMADGKFQVAYSIYIEVREFSDYLQFVSLIHRFIISDEAARF